MLKRQGERLWFICKRLMRTHNVVPERFSRSKRSSRLLKIAADSVGKIMIVPHPLVQFEC